MKHLLKYLMLPVLCLGMGNCSSSDDDPTLIVTNEYLNAPGKVTVIGTDGSFEIDANCKWTISDRPDWVTLSQNEGTNSGVITVTCSVNPSATANRTASMTVSTASGKVRKTVSIEQSASSEQLQVTPDQLHFVNSGEDKTITITANSDWTITGIDSWLELSQQSGSGNAEINVRAKANTEITERRAILTIAVSNQTKVEVEVVQEAMVLMLSVSPTNVEVDGHSQSYDLAVESNSEWTASSDQGWIVLSRTSGKGSTTLSLAISENTATEERTGTVTVLSQGIERVVNVTQQGATLARITDVSVSAGQDTFSATVTYASDYKIKTCGVCYSELNEIPTQYDNTIEGTADGLNGTFTCNARALFPGRTYYLRAYVETAAGLVYSDVVEVTMTGAPKPDDNPDIMP